MLTAPIYTSNVFDTLIKEVEKNNLAYYDAEWLS